MTMVAGIDFSQTFFICFIMTSFHSQEIHIFQVCRRNYCANYCGGIFFARENLQKFFFVGGIPSAPILSETLDVKEREFVNPREYSTLVFFR